MENEQQRDHDLACLTINPQEPLTVITNTDGSTTPEKPSTLPLPILRVEQLKGECGSPGSSSPYTSDSDFSDTDIISRLGEFIPPPDELALEIATQMDFYFSDENILKDSFLLKHARRNKEGYVNLKLLTSFKKMKTLTKDYRHVAYALRQHSKTLLVNADGNKVRRSIPLPEHDETKVSRTVIAVNLPMENPSMESVSSMFNPCGEIVMLHILKPGKSIPPEIKKHLLRHPYLQNVTCAVIEFEKYSMAEKAIAMSTPGEDWDSGLKVVMLATKGKARDNDDSESDSDVAQRRPNRKKRGKDWKQGVEHEQDGLSSGSEGDFRMPKPRSRNGSFGTPNERSKQLLSPNSADKQKWPNNGNGGNSANNQRRRSVPLPQSPLVAGESPSPKPSPKPSPRPSPHTSPEMRRRCNSGSGSKNVTPDSSPGSSPWVQRRMQMTREMSPLAKGGKNPISIIRAPRGPEPGKGFWGGAGRGQPIKQQG